MDCEGEWGGWSACSHSCGPRGRQSRIFAVSRPASGGGAACAGRAGQAEERSCATQVECCVAASSCFGYSCDYWLEVDPVHFLSCDLLESSAVGGCDCTGCECPSCPATCQGFSCDYFLDIYSITCSKLEADYDCDCRGCKCSSTTPHPEEPKCVAETCRPPAEYFLVAETAEAPPADQDLATTTADATATPRIAVAPDVLLAGASCDVWRVLLPAVTCETMQDWGGCDCTGCTLCDASSSTSTAPETQETTKTTTPSLRSSSSSTSEKVEVDGAAALPRHGAALRALLLMWAVGAAALVRR